MGQYNLVTFILLASFMLPVLIGVFIPVSKYSMNLRKKSFGIGFSMLLSAILSLYLLRGIFYDNKEGFFEAIYDGLPRVIIGFVGEEASLIYGIFLPVLFVLVLLALILLHKIFRNIVIMPIKQCFSRAFKSKVYSVRILAKVLWQIPKSLCLVLCVSLLFNFISYYNSSTSLINLMNSSPPYQFIYSKAIQPLFKSNLVKKVPVLVNDSFKKALNVLPQQNYVDNQKFDLRQFDFRVREYFNGVTVEEATTSNEVINRCAKDIIGEETNEKRKAYLIYCWITENIKYDYDKAEMIMTENKCDESGAISAFNNRKGICFDYSCLFVAMSKAVNLKVRLITGLGFSGVSWGDHAWNQVYYTTEDRWINVDTTFGASGTDYFDNNDFQSDHKYYEVQGEW